MLESNNSPEVLVSTDWVAEHTEDPSIVIVEVNANLQTGYEQGHVPGAVGWSLRTDLEDTVKRDIPSIAQIESLMGKSGIDNETTIVLYADGNNRPATWAFWVLKYYRHGDVRLMNGGREKWIAEGKPISTDVPNPVAKTYKASIPNKTLRATKDYIVSNLGKGSINLLDSRTLEEFTGELSAVPGSAGAGISRSGRIPGAILSGWDDGFAEDGSFKPTEELRRVYSEKGFGRDKEIVTYCRLGVKSSYSWFVLKYILGYERVRNYDGSWTEWGNSVGVPIETDVNPSVRA